MLYKIMFNWKQNPLSAAVLSCCFDILFHMVRYWRRWWSFTLVLFRHCACRIAGNAPYVSANISFILQLLCHSDVPHIHIGVAVASWFLVWVEFGSFRLAKCSRSSHSLSMYIILIWPFHKVSSRKCPENTHAELVGNKKYVSEIRCIFIIWLSLGWWRDV